MFLNPLLYQRMLGLVLYGRGIDAKNGRYPGLNMSRYLGDLLGHADAGVCCEAEVFEYPIGENDDIPFLRRRTRFDECLSPFAHMMHAHIVYIWEWGGVPKRDILPLRSFGPGGGQVLGGGRVSARAPFSVLGGSWCPA